MQVQTFVFQQFGSISSSTSSFASIPPRIKSAGALQKRNDEGGNEQIRVLDEDPNAEGGNENTELINDVDGSNRGIQNEYTIRVNVENV
ncbi:hypothetical protein Tco_0179232 [Tanacetum coccineum]